MESWIVINFKTEKIGGSSLQGVMIIEKDLIQQLPQAQGLRGQFALYSKLLHVEQNFFNITA